jgi:hypothetical protein
MLNAHLHDALRQRKNLVVTAIDFTSAFATFADGLIMSTIRQLNFPEWTQNLTAKLCSGAIPAIQLKRNRSDRTERKKGVKEAWPLSPLRFKHMLAKTDGRLVCFPSG